MIIPSTKYKLVKELPLQQIAEHSTHRRLGVFVRSGFDCANPACNQVGTRLIVASDRGGNAHVDVYTDDLTLMTVDHVVPVSKGGSNTFDNKVPMCQPCNSRKGNNFEGLEGFDSLPSKEELKRRIQYGRRWRKVVRRVKSFTLLDTPKMSFRILTIQELRRGERR